MQWITLRCKKRIDRCKEVIQEIRNCDLADEDKQFLIDLCEKEILHNYQKGV